MWTKVFDELMVRWSEPHRYFHGLGHCGEGVMHITQHLEDLDDWCAVFKQWISHDVINTPGSEHNERCSALLHEKLFGSLGIDGRKLNIDKQAIESTHSHLVPNGYQGSVSDLHFLHSTDLYPIGLPRHEFIRRGEMLRKEESLTAQEWTKKRKKWAINFKELHPIIYLHPAFEEYEERAQANIAWAMNN